MQSDIRLFSAKALMEAYQQKILSPVEVMETVLTQAETVNPHINALFSIKPDMNQSS